MIEINKSPEIKPSSKLLYMGSIPIPSSIVRVYFRKYLFLLRVQTQTQKESIYGIDNIFEKALLRLRIKSTDITEEDMTKGLLRIFKLQRKVYSVTLK